MSQETLSGLMNLQMRANHDGSSHGIGESVNPGLPASEMSDDDRGHCHRTEGVLRGRARLGVTASCYPPLQNLGTRLSQQGSGPGCANLARHAPP